MKNRRKPRPKAAGTPASPPPQETPPRKSGERGGEGSRSALEALKRQQRTRPGELVDLPEAPKPAD